MSWQDPQREYWAKKRVAVYTCVDTPEGRVHVFPDGSYGISDTDSVKPLSEEEAMRMLRDDDGGSK